MPEVAQRVGAKIRNQATHPATGSSPLPPSPWFQPHAGASWASFPREAAGTASLSCPLRDELGGLGRGPPAAARGARSPDPSV